MDGLGWTISENFFGVFHPQLGGAEWCWGEVHGIGSLDRIDIFDCLCSAVSVCVFQCFPADAFFI